MSLVKTSLTSVTPFCNVSSSVTSSLASTPCGESYYIGVSIRKALDSARITKRGSYPLDNAVNWVAQKVMGSYQTACHVGGYVRSWANYIDSKLSFGPFMVRAASSNQLDKEFLSELTVYYKYTNLKAMQSVLTTFSLQNAANAFRTAIKEFEEYENAKQSFRLVNAATKINEAYSAVILNSGLLTSLNPNQTQREKSRNPTFGPIILQSAELGFELTKFKIKILYELAVSTGSILEFANIDTAISEFQEFFSNAQLESLNDFCEYFGARSLIGLDGKVHPTENHSKIYVSSLAFRAFSPKFSKRIQFLTLPQRIEKFINGLITMGETRENDLKERGIKDYQIVYLPFAREVSEDFRFFLQREKPKGFSHQQLGIKFARHFYEKYQKEEWMYPIDITKFKEYEFFKELQTTMNRAKETLRQILELFSGLGDPIESLTKEAMKMVLNEGRNLADVKKYIISEYPKYRDEL